MTRRCLDRLAALLLGLLLIGVISVLWRTLAINTSKGILGDIEIYRGALLVQASGGGLYTFVYEHPTVHGLGFTYPPFAALVLQPITWVPEAVLNQVWVVLTIAVMAFSVWFVVNAAAARGDSLLGATPSTARTWATTFGLLTLAALTFPFIHHFVVGQVSLFIIVLCLVDVGGLVPPRWRGVLVGVAAAIKLTPLIFLPYFLVSRQYRAAAVSLASFVGATALAWAVFPADSLAYWTDKVFQTSRVGALDSVISKSLLGTISRAGLTSPVATAVWLALGALVAAVVLWRIRIDLRRPPIVAALEVGCLGTLLSPISWPHHLLWVVLAGCWLLLQRDPGRLLLGAFLWLAMLLHRGFLEAASPTLTDRLLWELPVLAVVVTCAVGLIRSGVDQGVVPTGNQTR